MDKVDFLNPLICLIYHAFQVDVYMYRPAFIVTYKNIGYIKFLKIIN